MENPLFWKTKTEAVKLIKKHGCSQLITSTISCSHVYGMSKDKPHCGKCSQCIDRRFATLHDDLKAHDSHVHYRHDLLLDEWEENEPRTLAESYVRFFINVRAASHRDLFTRFAGELSRAIQWLPGDRDANARGLIDTHKRHGEEVFSVLEREVTRHARRLLDGSLPPFCLLRMAVSRDRQLERVATTTLADEEASTAHASEQRPAEESRIPEVWIAVDDENRMVLADGGLQLRGEPTFKLLKFLLGRFEEDQRSRMLPEEYRFSPARVIAQVMRVQEPTVRKRVEIIRKLLFEWHAHDYPLSNQALIENNPWNGYRINPAVRLLKLPEVPSADRASQLSG